MNKYNPEIKYRCDIIRGKAQSEMDDLLPLYADITHTLAPMDAKTFNEQFDKLLSEKRVVAIKTVKNQRSEMGRLFALYYEHDGTVFESDACKFLKESSDQPAFFKNMCLNFQFPNGTQKKETVTKRIKDGIRFKPYHFILTLLDMALKEGITLEKREVEYYALSSKEVLQGRVTPQTVLEYIIRDRKNGETKELTATSFSSDPKEHSYIHQHYTELFNYLELANLITQDRTSLYLNAKERKIIDVFIAEINNIRDLEGLDENGNATEDTRDRWAKTYGTLFHGETILITSVDAIVREKEPPITIPDEKEKQFTSNEIAYEGEQFVLKKEKERVRAIRPTWENRVQYLGNKRGLGYDILSVDPNEDCTKAFNRLIEVKTTKRITQPKFSEAWRENIEITAKEWESAEQYREHYYIYRVFITPLGYQFYIVNNLYQKYLDKELLVYPIRYQVDIPRKTIGTIHNG